MKKILIIALFIGSLVSGYSQELYPVKTASTSKTFLECLNEYLASATMPSHNHVKANITDFSHTHPTSEIASGTFADARIAQSSVTQHQASLTISQSQVTSLASDMALKAPLISPTFTTPNIGAATGTSLTATGAILSSGTAGIGYTTGAGGTVSQTGNKSTGVTLNKLTGQITMVNSALAAATIVSFTLTNSTITATDQVIVTHQSGGTSAAYTVNAFPGSGSAVISLRNNTAGSLGEAVVIKFTVIKAVTN